MTQSQVKDIVSVQPAIGTEASNTSSAAPARDAPGPGCFATFWNKVSPCLEIGVMVGSAVAKQALVSRLANNNTLTAEQKTAITRAVSTIIEHQGKITISNLNQMIDKGVSRLLLEQLAKDTVANVTAAAEPLIQVGSTEATEAIMSRLANNNTLTEEQKTAITRAVSTMIEHQGKITISNLNQMIDKGVSRLLLEQLAKDTVANVTAAAEPLIQVGSTEATEAIMSRLANNNTLTAEQKTAITTAVSTMIEHQGKITISNLNQMIDKGVSRLLLEQLAKDTVANVTAAAEPLIQVGSTEATEAIMSRLANNNTLTEEQKTAITTAVSTIIEHQGNITLTAMNILVDSTTSHLVLAQLAKDMVANIAATTQPFVDIGTDLAITATEDALGLPDGSLAAAASMSFAGAVSDNVDHLAS